MYTVGESPGTGMGNNALSSHIHVIKNKQVSICMKPVNTWHLTMALNRDHGMFLKTITHWLSRSNQKPGSSHSGRYSFGFLINLWFCCVFNEELSVFLCSIEETWANSTCPILHLCWFHCSFAMEICEYHYLSLSQWTGAWHHNASESSHLFWTVCMWHTD